MYDNSIKYFCLFFVYFCLHKSEEKRPGLLEVYKYHNLQFEKLVGLEYSAGTFRKFKSAIKSLKAFIEWKFNKPEICLHQVDHKFV